MRYVFSSFLCFNYWDTLPNPFGLRVALLLFAGSHLKFKFSPFSGELNSTKFTINSESPKWKLKPWYNYNIWMYINYDYDKIITAGMH